MAKEKFERTKPHVNVGTIGHVRDYTRPMAEVRQREQGVTDKQDRGRNVLTFEEMRRGQIGLCLATQIARYVAPDNPLPGWNSPEIAWAVTQSQLAWYRAMEEAGQMVQIVDRPGLNRLVDLWRHDPPADAPIGYVLSLEGADSILTPAHLERAYADGLRAVGPAHYGPGRYAPGTAAEGGLTPLGRELLCEMRQLGIVLDATHLTDQAFWEALDLFDGPVWADVSKEGKKVLDKVITILKDAKDKRIQVEGHTDNVRIFSAIKTKYPTNWELSVARATQVVRYLQEQGGLDPKLLSATGYSEYQPLAPNDTDEGKAKNRRIDIVLLPLLK